MTPLHLDFHENRAFRGTSHGAGSDIPPPVRGAGKGVVRTGAFVDGDEGLARIGCGFFSGNGRPNRRGWALRGAGVWFVFFSHLALGNPVLDWSALMLDAIRTETTAPTVSSRNLAILNVATYEAVNSIDRTHQPYRAYLEVQAGASPEAAVIAAGREVMRALYPSMAARTEELYGKGLGALPDDVRRADGVALGRLSAQRMIEARISDGSTTTVPYIPSSAPGQWQRTPPFFRPPLDPHWGRVDPFCLPDVEAFLPEPPPALTSAAYAAAVDEVQRLGGTVSAVRTEEQSQIAVFWSDFSYTAMPPGHWHEIAAGICRSQGTSLRDSARLFALLGMAQADAAMVCWEAKYRWNLWRPISAIRRASEDDNPATTADANWNHYLASPPFPAYPSGHSTFSKASAQVLTFFYGRDDVAFTARSDSLPRVSRSFSSLAACAEEVGMSRIYGGIHFSFDNVAGKKTGGRVGDFVCANFLIPLEELPQVRLESFASGAPVLRIHGHAGATLVVEGSTGLQEWTPISTNAASMGGVVVIDTRLGRGEAGFYRVKEL